MSKSENSQLIINMIAQVGVFVISLGISIFLTPFIVKNLGVEAYGFVGLSNTIIGYMQIITIALNSMAGRFITIEYHKGDLSKANKYFSSVCFANCIFGAIVFFICMCILYYLELIVEIRDSLIPDVKLLFFILSINTVISLIFNVYIVPPFIKNKLEITALRNLLSSIIKVIVLVALFSLLTPKLWYIGISALICTLYLVYANIIIKRKLTPELVVYVRDFNWAYVKEIMSSGFWNLINRVSVMLEKGFDLLLANWFISSYVMGLFSITQQITIQIPHVINLIGSSFAPSITEYFAKGDYENINRNVFKSIRIMSLLVIIPLSIIYVYGDVFFSLWMPEQNGKLLQLIAILTTVDFIFGMPLEIFWNVFTATNKIKVPAVIMVIVGLLTISTLLVLLSIFKETTAQILCLASARMFWNTIKNLTFLPIYGAKCLNLKWNYFYKSMFMPIIGIIISLLICQLFRIFIMPKTWASFILVSFMTIVISVCIDGFFILKKEDIKYLFNKLNFSRI